MINYCYLPHKRLQNHSIATTTEPWYKPNCKKSEPSHPNKDNEATLCSSSQLFRAVQRNSELREAMSNEAISTIYKN